MEVKTVGVACDHAGFPLKQFVIQYLESKGYQYKDFGTYSDTSCDYPDFAHPLADGSRERRVLSWHRYLRQRRGNGDDTEQTSGHPRWSCMGQGSGGLIRQHNNANVLVMPGRFIANKLAETIMDEFFKTPFEGGRHERRVEKIPVK